MRNPLDYVTKNDLINLGLSENDLINAYQPSQGAVYHARGGEGKGKTLFCVHKIRELIDNNILSSCDGVGNITLKGKYGIGYEVLKGDDLRQFLWDMTHKPYKNKFVIIDEIDSEFPARKFTDSEQTEIALRMWHVQKLNNYIFMTSHIGNSTDTIFHLATHYFIYPESPDFETQTMDYTIFDRLNLTIEECVCYDVVKTMLIYNRQELTENTEEERNKIRPSLLKKNKKQKEIIDKYELDIEAEYEKGLIF